MASTMDEQLRYQIMEAPHDEYDVIVRVDCNTKQFAEQYECKGITVHRTYTLLPALAVTARGETLLALAADPHVTRIEADREVGAR